MHAKITHSSWISYGKSYHVSKTAKRFQNSGDRTEEVAPVGADLFMEAIGAALLYVLQWRYYRCHYVSV